MMLMMLLDVMEVMEMIMLGRAPLEQRSPDTDSHFDWREVETIPRGHGVNLKVPGWESVQSRANATSCSREKDRPRTCPCVPRWLVFYARNTGKISQRVLEGAQDPPLLQNLRGSISLRECRTDHASNMDRRAFL